MFQNGQTEPKPWLWVTRRRTKVRREAKFVRSKKALNFRKIDFDFSSRNNKTMVLNYFYLLRILPFCGLDFFDIPQISA